MTGKRLLTLVLLLLVSVIVFAREPGNGFYDSIEYDFFSEPNSIRPYLNFRTLSDFSADSWEALTLHDFLWFSSYNVYYPYGQNDKTLWQGKGLNTIVTMGISAKLGLLTFVFKPEIMFSQNRGFDMMPSSYSGREYSGRADPFGYYGIPSVDAPQRFGSDMLFQYSWGESEIRFSWKRFTLGFGTQSIWLGPTRFNPLLFSHNAPPFPKLDLGIRRTGLSLFGAYLGDIETRILWGRLKESEYFDTVDSNNYTLISALTFSYNPSFSPDLTIGFHRVMTSKWGEDDSGIATLLNPVMSSSAGKDRRDQRASITVEYLIPEAGMQLYLEWGRNDYSPSLDFILRYPFHTQAYTFGVMKDIPASKGRNPSYSLFLEWTNLESSRDYEIIGWATTFYAHHIVTQGYTNEGQWLGAGIGTGGNSQIVGMIVWLPTTRLLFYLQRRNPDNDYVWFNADNRDWEYSFRTDLSLGLRVYQRISSRIIMGVGGTFVDILNMYYEKNSTSIHRYNVNLLYSLRIKY